MMRVGRCCVRSTSRSFHSMSSSMTTQGGCWNLYKAIYSLRGVIFPEDEKRVSVLEFAP